ncbi:hypothetical protein [Algisphaera agarilytica]|uniref:Tetratricopeptide (TPR) repeat protein n=1 Tax=Algisphaera agarilytica TaxID=1385975 RepID=A0A7X0LMI9_9BACT|nr:hypothetical protein [Algisphaera agarilytica]MBB6431073.1 tetratricopeptide (TPR) repeat protein [Algisphaera agarilytica]
MSLRRTASPVRQFFLTAIIAAVLLASFASTHASAQLASDEVTGEQLVADMLLRLAMQTLSDPRNTGEELREDQLAQSQVMMDLALELSPDDADLWAKQIYLAELVGDSSAVLTALRRYVELKPEHDAFRLRLTLAELSEVETLDGRLAILEDKLAEARTFDYSDAYVSRLASAAASIAREIGNNDAFLKNLKTAVRADSANGEAAMLTYELALERGAKPLNIGAAAINLVRARPLDSDSRLLLADALYNLGVYDRAVRQFEVAAELPRGTPIPPSVWSTWSSSLIASGQTREAEDFIEQVEQELARPAEEGGAEAALPLELELHRRILHGDTEPGQAALKSVMDQLQARIDAGDNEAKLELAWITALFGEDTEPVGPMLEGQDRNDPRYIRATGFMFMREGAERWARNAFEQVSETDPISAYGLALLMGRDDAGRARFVRSVVHDHPGTLGGLLAASMLHELRRDVMPGPNGKAVVDAMNRLPIALWRFDIDRNPWVSMRANFDSSRSQFLETIDAELIVQNGLDIPLPIDPAVGLGNQAYISLSGFIAGQSIGQFPPMIIDMRGRLTLNPRERLITDIRIDRSIFGLFLTRSTPTTLTYNTTFTTDPRFLPNGALVPGTLGGIDTVRSLQAFVPAMAAENLTKWASDVASGVGLPRYVGLNRLARAGDALAPSAQVDRELSQLCIETLKTAYETSGPVDQAWILLMLTPDANNSQFQSILDEAKRSESDLVQVAFLSAHASGPDDTALTTAIRDGSPRVQRFAQGLQEFLRLPPAEAPAAP